MSWWWGYQATRGLSEWVRRELESPRDPGDGYILPDERARQAAHVRLAADPGVDSRDVQIRVLSGELRLSGSVPTEPMKVRAAQICAAVVGVASVENELSVK
ncbi:MAG TPA: BON domain-containing protein [Polyangiaceae bacterium]